MKKILIITAIAGLNFCLGGNSVLAAEEVFYGQSIPSAYKTYNSSNALNAPDEAYADMQGTDSSLMIDFGADLTDDLNLHYKLLNYQSRVSISFKDANGAFIKSAGGVVPLGEKWTIAYEETTAYRFVELRMTNNNTLKIDAVSVIQFDEAPVAAEEIPVAENPPSTYTGGNIVHGDLIKLPNDGNPETQADSTLYEYGLDGKRHAFPNAIVFFTWYKDFSEVSIKEFDSATLATIQIGDNVTVRPGTFILKKTFSEDYYAVEPNNVLRKISMETARELYGEDWKLSTYELADAFWKDYVVGEDVKVTSYPTGTFVVSPSKNMYYAQNGTLSIISSNTAVALKLQGQFIFPINVTRFGTYTLLGELKPTLALLYPY